MSVDSSDEQGNGPHPGDKRGKKFWVRVLVILAVIGALVPAAYWGFLWGIDQLFNEFIGGILPTVPYTGYTASMEPADITLVDKKGRPALELRIPKAYLTDGRTWKGGEHYQVEIQSVLPDMRPLAPLLATEAAPRTRADVGRTKVDPNRVLVWLVGQPAGNTLTGLYEMYREQYRLVATAVYGLDHFRRERCPKREGAAQTESRGSRLDCYPEQDFFFTPPARREVDIYFICIPPEHGPGVGCTGHTAYRGRKLEYTIRRSELARWQEIDTAVRAMLDRFIRDSTLMTS
jgi:hypothetical protein